MNTKTFGSFLWNHSEIFVDSDARRIFGFRPDQTIEDIMDLLELTDSRDGTNVHTWGPAVSDSSREEDKHFYSQFRINRRVINSAFLEWEERWISLSLTIIADDPEAAIRVLAGTVEDITDNCSGLLCLSEARLKRLELGQNHHD